jgi:hypothetical protein
MQKYIISFILLLIFFINNDLKAQNFDIKEKNLKILFDSLFYRDNIKYLKTDSEKKVLNDSIQKLFYELLQEDGSFNYPFDSLKHIGKIVSKNKLCKIITWNSKFSDGSFKYYGFIQYKNEKRNSVQTYLLSDKLDSVTNPETAVLSYFSWYGALYYDIYNYNFKGKNYYILFGWEGNNYYTNKKIIDILTFNNSGKPTFGKSVFKIENKLKKRLIFEFSLKATMTCKFNETVNAIVFDHLSPENPSEKGQFQFYGPDGTFDGLRFEKGKWELVPNIFVTNPKAKKNK